MHPSSSALAPAGRPSSPAEPAASSRAREVLARYRTQRAPGWPRLSLAVVQALLHAADSGPEADASPEVRLPRRIVQLGMLWAYTPPVWGFLQLPDGGALLENDLAHALEQALLAHLKSLPKRAQVLDYEAYAQVRDDQLLRAVLSCETDYVSVPLALAAALADWCACPQAGSFRDGPSVEDVLENLTMQAQRWSQVALDEEDATAGFFAVQEALLQTGLGSVDELVAALRVED